MSRPVSEAEARTLEAPSLGYCDATTTTATEYVDLSIWAGGYVTISCETVGHYISFGAATGFTMDVDAATLGSNYVAMPVSTGEKFHCVVDKEQPFLGYRTISDTGILRVHKS